MTEEVQTLPEATEAPSAVADRPSIESLAESSKRMMEEAGLAHQTESAEDTVPDADPDTVEGGEEEEDTGTEEVVPEASEEPKKGKGNIRIPLEVAERDKAKLRSQIDEAKAELANERARNAAMAEFLKKVAGGNEPESAEEEEVLDQTLEKKVNERFGKLEGRLEAESFNAALAKADTIGASKLPEYHAAVDTVLANEAYGIKVAMQARGKDISDHEAVQKAWERLQPELHEIYKETRSPESIAAYVIERAKVFGFGVKSGAAKVAAKKSTVNMDAVDRARREAAAPTFTRESVDMSAGDWKDDIGNRMADKYGAAEAKRRLAMFGMS